MRAIDRAIKVNNTATSILKTLQKSGLSPEEMLSALDAVSVAVTTESDFEIGHACSECACDAPDDEDVSDDEDTEDSKSEDAD